MDMVQETPSIEIAQVSEAHFEAVAIFFGKVWGKNQLSSEEIRRNLRSEAEINPVYPGKSSPAFVFIRNGVIIGYIGTIPTRFWDGDNELPGYWMKGFMVLEEYQNGPIGFYLLKEAMQKIDLAGVLTVAPASRRLFEATGFKNLGTLYNFITLIKPEKVLPTMNVDALGMSSLPNFMVTGLKFLQKTKLAFPVGLGLKMAGYLWKKIHLVSTGSYTITYIKDIKNQPELDAIWRDMAKTTTSSTVRDARYMSWRYDSKGSAYAYVQVWEKQKLRGIGVVRKPKEIPDKRLSGLKVASLSDIAFSPNDPKTGLIILNAAQKVASELHSDALLCSVSHHTLPALLKKSGYIKLPGNVNFLIKQPNDCKLSDQIDKWWLTRGDASSDEAF